MLNVTKTNTGLNIDYTKGDTFKLGITVGEDYENIQSIRLQIIKAGMPNEVIVEKTYTPTENVFTIQLSYSDTVKLSEGASYEYRLTFYRGSDVITTLSGMLNVKWGA